MPEENPLAEQLRELAGANEKLRLEMLAGHQARESLQALNEKLLQLGQAAQQLTSARDLESVFRITRSAARSLVGADGVTVVLREGNLCHYADEDAIAPLWKGKRFPMESCISGWVMLHDAPAVIADIYADPRIPVEAYRPTFVKSLAMLPLRVGQPLGAIGCYWAQPHSATAQEQQLIGLLADSTARAIDGVRRVEELARRLEDQQRTESLLRTSRQFSEAIVQTSPSLVVLCDPLGRIILFNRACEELTEYRSEEVTGRTLAELFLPPEWVPVVAARFADPFAPEVSQPHRNPWRTKSGALRLIEWRCAALPSPETGAPLILGIGNDVTDQQHMEENLKQAQASLRNNEERLRLMVQSVRNYAIFMLDDTGHVVSWNTGAELLKGYPAAEILGKHFSVFYPREDVAAGVPRDLLASASSEGYSEHHGWRIRKDGTRFFAHVVISAIRDETGRLHGYVKVTQDMTEQRNLVEALAKSNRTLQSIFDAAPVAVLGLDLSGRVTSWSAGAERMFGWTAQEAMGCICPTVPPEGLPDFQQMIDRVVGQGTETLLRIRQKKDGRRITAKITPAPLHDENGRVSGAMVILEDVTEANRVHQLFERFFSTTATLNVITDSRGRLQRVNPACLAVSGYSEPELLAMRPLGWVDRRDRAFAMQELGRLRAGASIHGSELRLRCKDGAQRWLLVSAVPLSEEGLYLASAQDITDRRLMHERLRDSERQLQTFLYFSPMVIFIKDAAGRYLQVNRRFEECFGLDWGQVRGRTDAELFTPEQAKRFSANDRHVLDTGEAMEFEESARYTDGEHISVVSKFPLRNLQGEVYALGGIVTDITAQRRAAEALREQAHFFDETLNSLTSHIVVIDSGGSILAVNEAWKRFGAMNGLAPSSGRVGDNYLAVCRQAANQGDPLAEEIAAGIADVLAGRRTSFATEYPCHSPTEHRWFHMNVAPLSWHRQGAVIAHEDVTRAKLVADAVRAVAQGVASHSGEAFFQTMVDQLSGALGAEHAIIGELLGDGTRIQVLASRAGSPIKAGEEYNLGGTPCERVMEKTLCSFPRGVAELYPRDQILKRLGIEGYLGTALFDSRQQPRGLIALMSDRPDKVPEFAPDLLQIVAARVAGEMERVATERSLRLMAGRVLHLQDHERRLLGRELHDSTAQGLAALEIHLSTLHMDKALLPLRSRRALRNAIELAGNCTREIRTLAFSLRPPLLDELGLVAALRVLVQGFARRSGIRCSFAGPRAWRGLPPEAELALYRVAQEALANVHRHSGSRSADVRLRRDRRQIFMSVADRGRGIPPATAAALLDGRGPVGIGLTGMAERMRQLGGKLTLRSGRHGTRISVVLPCPPTRPS